MSNSKSPQDFANHQRFIWYVLACAASPRKQPKSAMQYAHRLSQGMKAKKYKGGVAVKAKASSQRLFDKFFRPLPTP